MNRFIVSVIVLTGCAQPLDAECFAAATEGECVEIEGPLILPPQSAADFETVRAACSAPCIKTRREVRLSRQRDDTGPVPLLAKIQFPFALSVSELDHGKDLRVGPMPGLAWFTGAFQSNLRSFEGLEAPRLASVVVQEMSGLQSLVGLKPNPEVRMALSLTSVDLVDFAGLEEFTTLAGIGIETSYKLQSLKGLEGLTQTDDLSLIATSIPSLEGLNPALKASSVTFQGNRQLSNCEATEVANRIATTVRVLVAENKACP